MLERPLQSLLDRGVERSATAGGLCRRLEGRVLQISPGSAALARYFSVTDGKLVLHAGVCEHADATLEGTPVGLAMLTLGDPEVVIRQGQVRVSGDADVAAEFQALLDCARPDWEEVLSGATGDVVAHEVGNAVRGALGWAGKAQRSLGRSLAEFLTEESRDLAARTEVEEFCADVDALTLAVDRLEARLQNFRNRSQTN